MGWCLERGTLGSEVDCLIHFLPMNSLIKYILSTYCVPGTLLGTEKTRLKRPISLISRASRTTGGQIKKPKNHTPSASHLGLDFLIAPSYWKEK